MDRLNISPLRGSKMLDYNYIYNHCIPSGLVAVAKKSRKDDKIVEKIKNELKPTNPEGVKLL